MSTCFWMIEGIGLNAKDIESRVSTEKVVRFFAKQLPDKPELIDMIMSNDFSKFDINDYMYGNGFENIADVLCHCDDTDSITFGDDGNGNCYFYYPPSMPWHHTKTEPKSEEEVISRIISAVKKITDMSPYEIRELICTDLYVVGIG